MHFKVFSSAFLVKFLNVLRESEKYCTCTTACKTNKRGEGRGAMTTGGGGGGS